MRYGDETQTWYFTFIGDIVEANRTLLETDAADGELMTIGSTDNIEIQVLAEEIRDQLAPHLELEYSEHTYADISKATNSSATN